MFLHFSNHLMDHRHGEILCIQEISVLPGLVNFLPTSLPCKFPKFIDQRCLLYRKIHSKETHCNKDHSVPKKILLVLSLAIIAGLKAFSACPLCRTPAVKKCLLPKVAVLLLLTSMQHDFANTSSKCSPQEERERSCCNIFLSFVLMTLG